MKRIIVLCDGTGHSECRLGTGDSTSTNVARFSNLLVHGPSADGVEQSVRYRSGVGTQNIGMGRLDDVIKLVQKGAFTARVVANLIARLGILVIDDHKFLRPALRAHKDGHLDNFASRCQIISGNAGITAADRTVASLGVHLITNPGGVSREYQHFDAGLVKGIKHAFHALALDEHRGPFTPLLWHLPTDVDPDSGIVLQQCWFPGAHSNVGGGYPDRALSNLSLVWMIDQCRSLLGFDPTRLQEFFQKGDRDPPFGIEERQLSPEDQQENRRTDARINVGLNRGWGRGICYDSYKQGKTWTWKYRTPGAYSVGGETRETMHASVRLRWQSSRDYGMDLTTGPPIYAPMALKGFELRKDTESNRWEWVKSSRRPWWSWNQSLVKIPESDFPTISGSPESSAEQQLFNSHLSI